MSYKERTTRRIHDFLKGNMSWESALDLIVIVAKLEEWIDYLLKEMESIEVSILMRFNDNVD
ncbi:hypothetical protein DYD21_08870 [Rhodohalobacter sp. SW132]|nr:hypothetical protein DYD21_08870 [Rhodohalobacter sp. SW132]